MPWSRRFPKCQQELPMAQGEGHAPGDGSKSPSRYSPHQPLPFLPCLTPWNPCPSCLQYPWLKGPFLLCWAHQPPRGRPHSSRGQGWRLCSVGPGPGPLTLLWPIHALSLRSSPILPQCQQPSRTLGTFVSLVSLPQGGTDAWMRVVHGARPHLTGSVGSKGFGLQAARLRRRRLEASACYDWSGIQVFLCALPQPRVKGQGALPLAAIVGRTPR